MVGVGVGSGVAPGVKVGVGVGVLLAGAGVTSLTVTGVGVAVSIGDGAALGALTSGVESSDWQAIKASPNVKTTNKAAYRIIKGIMPRSRRAAKSMKNE